MNDSRQLESLFWKVLEKNRLGDLSQFHRSEFCDEVPLVTRESDLAFLSELRRAEANAFVLISSLKYLRSIVSYEEHHNPYFAAISVWKFPTKDWIVPNLFVYAGPVHKLRDALHLTATTTPFGRRVNSLVPHGDLPGRFIFREDVSTLPKMPRVFIGPSESPYPNFITLDALGSPLEHARR